jgi:hypothetical protein
MAVTTGETFLVVQKESALRPQASLSIGKNSNGMIRFLGSQDPESDEDSCRSFVFVFWPRFIFWPFAFLRA